MNVTTLNEAIDYCEADAFTVPTDGPESDGTATWDSTTMVLVRLGAGKVRGLGYTYSHDCCARLIREKLFPLVRGSSVLDVRGIWEKMNASVRNFGKRGIAAAAIAAVDIALWDLKARVLEVPLVNLLGALRRAIPVYGSGGFTSYSRAQLRRQFSQWAKSGISMVKMKVGREPDKDPARVAEARTAIGDKVKLFVDANGACTQKQALTLAESLLEYDVSWLEEPVSSDNLNGLRFIRERAPHRMEIAAGEYNYDLIEARRMLEAQAVDVLQADTTRCGITGFMQMAELCEAFDIPLSAHTAPAVHAHVCCAAPQARHVEYFHDHTRIEQMFFEGATTAHQDGHLRPDLSQPGLGLEFKPQNAEKFHIDV
jgi:L-alanine-DL-glutamate epimerase-like enolase superfamily enzyme